MGQKESENSREKEESQQEENKKSSKLYHKVKKGDTYWGCARKYGTTVNALRQLNPGRTEEFR
ncbi:LysM domain-containing protein [Bacillus stercoris]|nr:LysM domain-containing protein [Bacillus stercoris]